MINDINLIVIISIIIIIIIIIITILIYNDNNNQVLTLKSNPSSLLININKPIKSMIKLGDKYIGLIKDESKNYSRLSYIEINIENIKNITSTDIINFDNLNRFNDAILFVLKNEYWYIVKYSNATYLAKIYDPKSTLKLFCNSDKSYKRNFIPFIHNDKLYYEISISPHIIYEVDTENNANIIKSNYNFKYKSEHLNNCISPILISHFREQLYLSIGHIEISQNDYHFFYVFQNYPPFKIIGSSEIFKLDNAEQKQIINGLSIDKDLLHISYRANNRYNKISFFNIYDINYKIKYNHEYINSVISKSLKTQHKLTIVVIENFNEDLQKFCDKHRYKLLSFDAYIKNRLYDNEMVLFLNDNNKYLINYDINFDNILNIAGISDYIQFEESLNIITRDKQFVPHTYDTSDYDLLDRANIKTIINTGYPYRSNNRIILHKNYLDQILYSEKSMFDNDITIMPSIINPIKKSNNTKIPKIIHQSFGSKVIPECLVSAAYAWLNLNPDYEYRYYDNGDCRKLIANNFDKDVLEAFDMIIPGAYRCDLWRVCAIYLYGGIYADIKLGAVFPIKNIIDEDSDYLLINDLLDNTIYNGLFGAKARDPLIYKVIMVTVQRILNKEYGMHKLYPTGPMAVGSVIVKEFGFDKHMKTGKYKINDSVVQVYDHHDDGKWGRTINDKNDNVLINFRHSTKTSDQQLFNSITGNSHYSVLWEQRKIYRET